MTKTFPLFPLLACLALTGCIEGAAVGAATGIGMYETRPDDLPPADIADQIPPHESWCYSTMGEQVECFTEPQETPPGRLVMVDPPSAYPLTYHEYQLAVAKAKAANAPPAPPVVVPPNSTVVIEPAPVVPPPEVAAPIAPPQKAVPPKHKKHKKKPKKTVNPPLTVPPPAQPPALPPELQATPDGITP